MQAGTKREIAVVIGALITIGFFLVIPAISPGFPAPVVTGTKYWSESSPGGIQHFYLTGTVTNEGTSGNVIVTAKLVGASGNTAAARSTITIFMQPGEKRTVSMTVTGRTAEPYDIILEAKRR